jgi:catechol 2,3-dioxygenase
MSLRPTGIYRLGYVRLAIGPDDDLGAIRRFYGGVVGLLPDERSSDTQVLYRCWHEAHPYSLIFEIGHARGLIEVGFEVANDTDLAKLEARARSGAANPVRSDHAIGLPGLFHSVAIEAPGPLRLRLYTALDETPAYVTGHAAPDWVTPPALRSTCAPLYLNHVGVTVPDPAATVGFLTDVLGFVVAEQIVSDDRQQLRSALLFRMAKDVGGQELAIFAGPRSAVHHVAFTKEDPGDILIDAQYLRAARVRLDPTGPTRQSYGKTFSLHFYDPLGLRLELCSGGRMTEVHPEFEAVVWTESHFDKALSFHDESVSAQFLVASY